MFTSRPPACPLDVDIRHATPDDAVDIAALLGELGYPQQPAELVARLDALTSDGHLILVAAAGQRLVGVVSAVAIPLLAEAATLVRITAPSVTQSAREHRVGRALVEAVERNGRYQDATIEVGSGRRPERTAAHRHRPAMGFVGRQPHRGTLSEAPQRRATAMT